MCGLTEEEVLEIAQHEHIPEAAAAELANYLAQTPDGELCIKAMIRDDIAAAASAGDASRLLSLKLMLRDFVLQHYRYGRGMAQVLARHPIPPTGDGDDENAKQPSGLGMLRPNKQVDGPHGFVGVVVRRVSLAAGRTVGLADERLHHRPAGKRQTAAFVGGRPAERLRTQNGAH